MQIIYLCSLAILSLAIFFTVVKPLALGRKYTEISSHSLLKSGDEWILQFDLLNHEDRDIQYTIRYLVGDKESRDIFLVRDRHKNTIVHHINQTDAADGKITYMIFREKETSPLEQSTYYLK